MMASEGAQMQRRSNSTGSMAPPGLDGPPHDVEGGLDQERYDYMGGKSKGFQSLRGKSGAPPIIRMLSGVDFRAYYFLGFVAAAAAIYAGALTSHIVLMVLLVCMGSLLFAWYLATWVLAKDEGSSAMINVATAIREGANGFLRTQYGAISRMSLLLALGILLLYLFRRVTPEQQAVGLESSTLAGVMVFAFLLGALCSGAAGFVGMWISVRANVRVASAARRSAREALQIAVRAGGFCALLVVGLVVLGVALLYCALALFFDVESHGGMKATDLPLLLVGFGFGASFVALFAQLGGGIFTKAADVGADLCGKVDLSIPEDDVRNPAVIADLVGDNVGDCAARGADLFESIAAEVISAMILGASMARKCRLEDPSGFILFPLVVHSVDLVVSAAGIISIRSTRASHRVGTEDPLAVLLGGYSVTLVLAIGSFVAATRWLLHTEQAPQAWMHFAACGLVGAATAYAFVWISQFYTDYKYYPVRRVAEASVTGHGTNVIAGMGLGLESTGLPVLAISAAIVASYRLGRTSGLVDDGGEPVGGLMGTAVATMGMLSSAAYVLTMDIFGPITDNAGGIAEMSDQPASVREVTDLLDAVGNTTKATTKGFAIGSAALASFLLFSAYMDEVATFSGIPFKQVDIAIPEVFVGGLLGAALVFVFSSCSCTAVGRAAQGVVKEVRRQLSERPGILTYDERPDYSSCVSIVAESALREMITPGLLALLTPIITGVTFRFIGQWTEQPLLGAKAVAGLLMFATVSGVLMALFLNTAGGAWDNAKKYIEAGHLGGKGGDTHKAAVTGDTVGDPFKDTAGPSLHVLIKMLSTITLVMAPLFLDS